LEEGGDEDVAIAALLHDSAEDQGGKPRLEDVRNRFGDRVANIVKGCSDSLANTSKGEKKADKATRNKDYLGHLETADEDVLRVSLADKVHNARSVLRDLRNPEVGESVWSRFKQPREEMVRYYRSLTNIFQKRLPGQLALANELCEIVDALEKTLA